MKEKYVLLEWPESQEFLGHPDCYIAEESACFVPEELLLELESQNKTISEIETIAEQYNNLEELLRNSIHNYLSRKLMDTSEDTPLEIDIALECKESFGLSSLDLPWIKKIWQDPVEGIIYFVYDTDTVIEFDRMNTENLLTICKHIE